MRGERSLLNCVAPHDCSLGIADRDLEKILQIFIVVVVQTVNRDALAVALQFAAHVETGPRKQGCPSVPAK
jgi:hypothetical protein